MRTCFSLLLTGLLISAMSIAVFASPNDVSFEEEVTTATPSSYIEAEYEPVEERLVKCYFPPLTDFKR